MALRGTLGDFSLTDILQLISHQRKSGTLVLRRGEEVVSVGFDAGRVVSAEATSRTAEQRLGHLLVRTGALSESRLAEALRLQKTSLERLGHLLVRRGWVDRETVQRQLLLQLTDTLFDLFRWKDGDYDFHPGPVDWDREFIEPLSSQTLLMEGARMVDEWPIVERTIPHRRVVLRMTPRAASLLATTPDAPEARGSVYEEDFDLGFIPADPLQEQAQKSQFTERERAVLRWIDGRRTVGEVAELSGLGTFESYHLLANLIKGGFLAAAPSAEDERPTRRRSVLRAAVPARALSAAVVTLTILGIASGVQEGLRAFLPAPRVLPATSPIADADHLARLASVEPLRESVSSSRLDRIETALRTSFLAQGAWARTPGELAAQDLIPAHFAADPWGEPYILEFRAWGYRLSESAPPGRTAQVRERRFTPLERSVAGVAAEGAVPAP